LFSSLSEGASDESKEPNLSPLYAASAKLALKYVMDSPPVAKAELRPWRSQIDALLAGIPMNPAVRDALLDSFEEHGLVAYSKTEPETAADEFGRLNKSRVEKALKNFDEHVRVQVVSVLESLHAIA
jgi:hypothetical protein